ncbi:hypothetical protein NPIL_574891 [Nephila pilipes]|uniref:Uncharacterized protein n=1 Tax=Nephila pilipes TaxID=299642 RepID=A0A8X6MTS7_NEPPI|nr:hypothetical protein NPIL_574891 [Nephila pilipes]
MFCELQTKRRISISFHTSKGKHFPATSPVSSHSNILRLLKIHFGRACLLFRTTRITNEGKKYDQNGIDERRVKTPRPKTSSNASSKQFIHRQER